MAKAIEEMSTAALAYLGDCVMELCVRELLVSELGISSSGSLNTKALSFVRAPSQAAAVENILPVLTDAEAAAYRRGRNIGHTNVPRGSTVAQYRKATGLEALFGYLHAIGERDRINELFRLAFAEEISHLKEEKEKLK